MPLPTDIAVQIIETRTYIDDAGIVRVKDESAVAVARAYLKALNRSIPLPRLDMREQRLKYPHEQ